MTVRRLLFFMATCCLPFIATSQASKGEQIARAYLAEIAVSWGLQPSDISDVALNHEYSSRSNGVTHVFLTQQHAGIEVYNGIVNVNIKDGRVVYAGNRFEAGLAGRVNTTTETVSPLEALLITMKHLGLSGYDEPTLLSVTDDKLYVYGRGGYAQHDVPLILKYQPMPDGTVRLAWDLSIEAVGGADYWSLRIDAVTGAILNQNSWTTHCAFPHGTYSATENCTDNAPESVISTQNTTKSLNSAGSYRVYPLPAESPSHGDQLIVTDPADATASPFGWHDTNGQQGNEYTITRGNNVHAFADTDGNDVSDGGEPDGGASLIFDFEHDTLAEPLVNKQPATVNLFYMNNMMHDLMYHYGFDEESGNFQSKNYTNQGAGNDYVLAQALDNLNGGSINNANFSTPPDGNSGAMQMFGWNMGGSTNVHVTDPFDADYVGGTGDFGAVISGVPVTGLVEIVNDGTGTPTLGCEPLENTTMAGKIALVDRGTCNFSLKAYYAQEAGAIGCLICNYLEQTINMTGGTSAADVTIPSAFVPKSVCDAIRNLTANGVTMSFYTTAAPVPAQLDGDFDNGIIAHEYGHGISNRLTGGPNNSGCLGNAEQMGEGWSDFFALAVSVKPGDTGDMNRGVGTYVTRQSTDGIGIRRYPYSTDMNVNPLVYDDVIANTEVHALGEVWTVMLWDLYWAMVDKYGFDPDLANGTAGNNRAIKLVIDGLKLQPCSPGFIDGRNAIFAADDINYNGEDYCLIYDVFARRGLGYGANQGAANSASDGLQSFVRYPFCDQRLKIKKQVTELIDAGDEITVTLKVYNHKLEGITDVVVTDPIPVGCNYVAGSATGGGTLIGDAMIFNIASIATRDSVTLTYKLLSDPDNASIATFFNDFENGETGWYPESLDDINFGNYWALQNVFKYSGQTAFGVENIDTVSDMVLRFENPQMVSGTQPVLRFYHKYDTEQGADGGIVQLQTQSDPFWNDLGPKMFKNGYRGIIQYGTFAIPFQKAFWGNNQTFKPTYVDLSEYNGQNVTVRWRFGSDGNTGGTGWFVDDVLMMDMINYNTTATVTDAQGDTDNAAADARGTIVEPDFSVAAPLVPNQAAIQVFPNPAFDRLQINLGNIPTGPVSIQLLATDGRVVWQNNAPKSLGDGIMTTSAYIGHLPSGMYIVRVQTANGVLVQKVAKQ